jgi:UDP-glucose 4-epimerase
LLQTDVQDAKAAESYLQEQEIVFNLAGHSGPLGSIDEPFSNLEINCRGALTLLETARRINPVARVVFPSSRLVYGRPERLPVDEHHATYPTTIYGVHKLAAEGYHAVYYRTYGLESVVLRISNPYGPHKPAAHHLYNVMNWFIDRAVQGETLTVFEEGAQRRDYLYVGDLVEAFLLAGTSDRAVGETLNIGGAPVRFVDMARCVVQVVGRGSVEHVPWPSDYRTVETGDYVSDTAKALEILSWKPRTPLEDGIRLTVEALADDRSILRRVLEL